jgi:primosomal protein N' (replication factor Y)
MSEERAGTNRQAGQGEGTAGPSLPPAAKSAEVGSEGEDRAAAGGVSLPVLLPVPLDHPLHYRADTSLPPGTLVRVPLRGRLLVGAVWESGPLPPPGAPLRPIAEVLSEAPPLPCDLRRFISWLAAYTLTPQGEALALALRIAWRKRPRPVQSGEEREEAPPGAERSGEEKTKEETPPAPPLLFTPAQSEAAAALTARVREGGFGVTLLEGVTGSGKTEVYFEAIAAARAQGRQVLVLLPEIALSSQMLARFTRRFGTAPALWHSALGQRERRATWLGVAAGRIDVVIGARSALFLPFRDLGLIVVDEEHEPAYKQEEGVIYHARDMAVVRGREARAPVVLVSATPSLETLINVEEGRFAHLYLPGRPGRAELPAIGLIDLRRTPPPRGRFLSPPLAEAVGATLGRGEQAMLFLNRRGYAPLTLCRACGHRLQCPSCSAWLVEHRGKQRLLCHHCGYAAPRPALCPACGAEASLVAIGPGVERISEEVQALFPEARLAVMASDTLAAPAAAEALAAAVERREIDILVGTQIAAKGWHFPYLTLVGVVDADLGLMGGDLRAAERTFQLLHQVAGRAGRAEAPGRVLLQTHLPEHPVMAALAAGETARFLELEKRSRAEGGWPPYGRLAALILSGPRAEEVEEAASRLAAHRPLRPDVTIFGPAPAPLALLRGRHRVRFLVKGRRQAALAPLLRAWLAAVSVPRGVRVVVDIDPVSFL